MQRAHEIHMRHFDEYADERIVVQRSLVSTGMLLFAITCRLELHQHEPSWRETSKHLLQVTFGGGAPSRAMPSVTGACSDVEAHALQREKHRNALLAVHINRVG